MAVVRYSSLVDSGHGVCLLLIDFMERFNLKNLHEIEGNEQYCAGKLKH
jgi:hypothetical protein